MLGAVVSPMPKTLTELRVPFAIGAGLIWAFAFLIGILTRDYVALGVTTPVVSLVAAAIFTLKNSNGNGGR